VQLFCYGQVESPYGSGEFYRVLEEAFRQEHETLVLSEIESKEGFTIRSRRSLERENDEGRKPTMKVRDLMTKNLEARMMKSVRHSEGDFVILSSFDRHSTLCLCPPWSTASASLTPDLAEIQRQMEQHARELWAGLLQHDLRGRRSRPAQRRGGYGGFPTRYPHWRFGMEYEQLSKGYSYGLQKIYELVINNDPCYAYLLASNEVTDHKLVMAHVYGHCDFFKNNYWFSQDEPQDDRRDGQPRQSHPRLHGSLRRGRGRDVHRRLPEHRGPDRHPCAVHQAPRRREPLRLQDSDSTRKRTTAAQPTRFQAKATWIVRQSARAAKEQEAKERRERRRRRTSRPSRCAT
jgi:spore cortex formation protein SpoVR/YcgB (stage V sporulation)